MSAPTYRIYSGSEEVSNETGYPLTDEQEAKDLAQQVSAGQPGSTVTVKSILTQPGGGWTQIVGTFIDGKPHPWVWTVTFLGRLAADDNARLNLAGISYLGNNAEPYQGVMHGGAARHRLAVDAADANEAVQTVRDALGPIANQLRDWTSVPGDDQAIRFRLDDAQPPE